MVKMNLDIGSGNVPRHGENFVYADRFIEKSYHRGYTEVVIPEGHDFVKCDIHFLPFKDKVFNTVVCSHVLEHINNPEQGKKEINRVGDGYEIVLPHPVWEYMFALFNAETAHKWIAYNLDDFRLRKIDINRVDKLPLSLNIWKSLFDFIRHNKILSKLVVRIIISPFVYLYAYQQTYKK